MKVAIVTDSNSGITQNEAKQLGINVIPMPFTVDNKDYLEEINLSQDEFYSMLGDGADIVTSQPSIGVVQELWDNLLQTYDEMVYIPMSSGLSQSCNTAIFLAQEYNGKVAVVDNQRISCTQRQSVLDAIHLVEKGKNAAEIKEILEKNKYEASVYITVDTLKYLRKGGRVTAAGAALGALLKIKPVLQIQGFKLDAYAKARGMKSAKKIMLDAMGDDLKKRFDNGKNVSIHVEYTYDYEQAVAFAEEVKKTFKIKEIRIAPLPLSISCHLGPNALAVTCARIIND